MAFAYSFPRPSATVDTLLLRGDRPSLEVLLIRRGNPPFENQWALPGGFLDMDEPPLTGALRELQEETGLKGIHLRPLWAAGEPGRDPRGRCLTMVFGALVNATDFRATGGDDAAEAAWFPFHELPGMAFDHEHLVALGHRHLQWQAETSLIGWQFFSAPFTLESFQDLIQKTGIAQRASSLVSRGLAQGVLSQDEEGRHMFFRPSEDLGAPEWHPLVW